MSDPRFARLRSDPRFRRPRKHQSKVVVDDRFKEAFGKGKKNSKTGRHVDKYGRPISNTHEQDNLRRFYRLENEEGSVDAAPDYARGGVLLESSDEEDDARGPHDITVGCDRSEPISVPDEAEDEINMDEMTFADLDAQAAAYNKRAPPQETGSEEGEASPTSRLAVVNLDWDHVRASHLYKIFSSLVSPTAPSSSHSAHALPDQLHVNGGSSNVVRGKVLSVRVYPSEFGKERLAREETEGPPADVFKKRHSEEDEEVNERNIYDVGGEDEYDEDALRQYQLERLRYYYAIVTCDSIDAASHIYSELEGTELERSANVFDLSFVPDEMNFDGGYRDESTQDSNTTYKGIDFVTTALRHSKVQLTWDEDDAERNQVTRRTLTRQEIEEGEFKAYVASSGSDSGSDIDEDDSTKVKRGQNQSKAKAASRGELRALLLGNGDDDLPEGWGREDGERKCDVDMEITFMPGLSKVKGTEEETSLEKYQRKLTEKRKKRKEAIKEKGETKTKATNEEAEVSAEPSFRPLSTPNELALLIASDNPGAEPKHFNLKSVLKAEKKFKARRTKGRKPDNEDDEIQEHFSIDLKDDRFKALHEDHIFAIDPSNPRFKKTTSMVALLEERSKRLKDKRDGLESANSKPKSGKGAEQSLKSLVESVKRKSAARHQPGGGGKRRKL